MDAGSALPRRVVRVEERESDRPTVTLGQQALERGLSRGHLTPQNLRRYLHSPLLALERGKASDQEMDRSRVPGRCATNSRLHGSILSIRRGCGPLASDGVEPRTKAA